MENTQRSKLPPFWTTLLLRPFLHHNFSILNHYVKIKNRSLISTQTVKVGSWFSKRIFSSRFHGQTLDCPQALSWMIYNRFFQTMKPRWPFLSKVHGCFKIFQFFCHSGNKANLIEVLHSSAAIIKQHVVNSFLVTVIATSALLIFHLTREVFGLSWPIANHTLTRFDVRVTRQFVEYYCRAVTLLQSDGLTIIISDDDGSRAGTYNESTIVTPVWGACKHSGAHCSKTNKQTNK